MSPGAAIERSVADLHPLVRRAFACPGAVLIRSDTQGFAGMVEFELGLQQPRRHARFVNIFVDVNETSIYIKHDPARIADLYRAQPSRVRPSEIHRA